MSRYFDSNPGLDLSRLASMPSVWPCQGLGIEAVAGYFFPAVGSEIWHCTLADPVCVSSA